MKKLKAFVAMMLLSSFLSSSSIVAATSEPGLAYRKFVIYYGWYSDSEGRPGPDLDRIIRSKPEYVISPYYTSTGLVNLKPEVMDRLHESGIKVLVYVATWNSGRNLDAVFAEMKTRFDGVFFDEVAMLHAQPQVSYYREIYEHAKSFGSDKVVIANPGSILVSESIMSVSDIVSFEHQGALRHTLTGSRDTQPTALWGSRAMTLQT
jgi:hypothetical protein